MTVIPVGKWCPLLQHTNCNSQRSTSLLPRGQFSIALITESTPRERSSRCSLPTTEGSFGQACAGEKSDPQKPNPSVLELALHFQQSGTEHFYWAVTIHGRSGGNNPSVQHTKDMVVTAASMNNYPISNIYQLEWPDCTLRNMIRKRHTDTISPLLSVVTARWPSLSRQLVDWTQYSNTDATGEPNHPPVGYHYMLHQCNKYSLIDQLPTV